MKYKHTLIITLSLVWGISFLYSGLTGANFSSIAIIWKFIICR